MTISSDHIEQQECFHLSVAPALYSLCNILWRLIEQQLYGREELSQQRDTGLGLSDRVRGGSEEEGPFVQVIYNFQDCGSSTVVKHVLASLHIDMG